MNYKSVIESLLFIHGEPLSFKKIAKTLDLDVEEVKKGAQELKLRYEEKEVGLRIIEKGEEIQLVTAPENALYVQKLIQTDIRQDLTNVSLETLAIIAYRGPMSRSEIEDIRGIDSSFLLRRLLIRGLVERTEHPQDRRIYLYQITFNFLKSLGLQKIEDLPNYLEFHSHKINS